ncbi:MAG: TIGR03960 family B12-binding radical SAM protein [Deltaproteobacteria bacterium]|nr:TIGR03960 family B12-binding radical SAM protein [Deltaproteobacteria bacterium]
MQPLSNVCPTSQSSPTGVPVRYQPLDLDALVLTAQKPSRYVGGEVNAVVKDLPAMRTTWALCFPETYEVGMSNVGFRVLYHVLNARPDVACERAFMPWPDMVARMRAGRVPLWALESRAPARDFDILGFSLQFEAGYTTVLEMLDLAGVPILARDRGDGDPLVVAGGPCTFNGEPMAPFFDAMVLGDGEEVVLDLSDAVAQWKEARGARAELLEQIARIPGVYVPSFFQVRYAADRTLAAIEPLKPGYERATRRVVADLEQVPMPDRPIVPFMQAVHDRLPLEIQRGCVRGCRFCQVGMVSRPQRQRAPSTILAAAERGLARSGWEEVGFLSLSAGDYSCLNGLLESFFARFGPERIAISLPSLRTETMTEGLARQIAQIKKTGFTIAPEAATERLRRAINKGNSEESLLGAVRSVFGNGWGLVKLYFMIGLPTETEEDVLAIGHLAKRALRVAREIRKEAQINVSVSTFVPKPFTPFQWDAMISVEETMRRHDLLRAAFPRKGPLVYKYHEAQGSLVEAALARGDRRAASAVLAAWRAGQVLDGWTEHFSFERWQTAFQAMEQEHGISASWLANRERSTDEILPWDHLDAGVDKSFLLKERERSRQGETLVDCVAGSCSACGACDSKALENRLYTVSDLPPGPAPAGADGAAQGAASTEPPAQRVKGPLIRLRYAKRSRAIALGHLETMNAVLRALRRSGLPVSYSQGFNPRPRVSFGPACPVGVESEAEYIDLELATQVGAEGVRAALGPQMPTLLPLLEVQELDQGSPALGADLSAVRYLVQLGPGAEESELDRYVETFRAAEKVETSRVKADRRIRVVDLKAAVLHLERVKQGEVAFELKAGNEASAKPSEVLACVFPGLPVVRIAKQAVVFSQRVEKSE